MKDVDDEAGHRCSGPEDGGKVVPVKVADVTTVEFSEDSQTANVL